jgi:hypothetical protein
MKNVFLKYNYFLNFYSVFLFFSFFNINGDQVVKKNKIVENTVSNTDIKKKVRKVDISILRENLVNQLIEILQLVEKTLKKLLQKIDNPYFIEQSNEVMNIFGWINKCIQKFNEDPSIYGRSEIESYLNQAQKYKLFLNNI